MKILFSALAIVFVFSVNAQDQKDPKPGLSPLTRKYLAELKEIRERGNYPAGYIFKTGSDGELYAGALIRVDNTALAEAGLNGIGAHTGTKAGNIWTVQVPVERVEEFTLLEGINYIQLDEPVFPSMNIARRTTKADSVQAGYGLPKGYSGKDVIVGVIDFGFDYTHPTFYDTLGQRYRVKRVWELNGTGTPPPGYNYGHEITDTNAIRTRGTDNAKQTHGTGVAGIAAGSGFGSTGNSRFRGMAYDADMVFVGVRRDSIAGQWKEGGFSDFIDGINYIFSYATAQGKPCVVNISWGSQSGPHDGSTLFNQACENLVGKGKIIVMSAGNDGEEKIHLSKTFTSGDTLLSTFLKFTPANYKRTWIDIWGEAGKTFCAEVTLYKNGVAGNTTGMVCTDDQLHTKNLMAANGTDTCYVEFITSSAEFNNKPRVTIDIFNKSVDSIAVSIKGSDGTIHTWNEYYYYGYTNGYQCVFDSMGFNWARTGNTVSTVSDMGSGQSILLVGAYASKTSWIDINGSIWSYGTYVGVNKLVPFSSRGPLIDGRIKPDITAPGLTLATSYTSFDSSYSASGANSQRVVSAFTFPANGKKYHYGEFTGTSASAPAAAGIVALMLQANRNLSPQQVQDITRLTAITDIHTGTLPAAGNNDWGHGKINAYAAMKLAIQQTGTYTVSGKGPGCLLYPNPNKGSFTLEYMAGQAEELDLEVINITGSTVYSGKWKVDPGNNQSFFDMGHLAAGLYLVKISSAEGFTTVKTIID